jgi:hypothetical protein
LQNGLRVANSGHHNILPHIDGSKDIFFLALRILMPSGCNNVGVIRHVEQVQLLQVNVEGHFLQMLEMLHNQSLARHAQ